MESLSHTLNSLAGVEIVVWPQDESLRQSLARAGVPRLLVVADGAAPPEQVSFDEDWIREPFDHDDLRVRARRIIQAVRSQSTHAAWLDDERVLHRGARTAVLTASEAVVAEELLSHSGQVVDRESLQDRLWPSQDPPSPRAIDAIVYRLRRRCQELGLLIQTVRGRGFVLTAGPSVPSGPARN